MDWIIVAMAVSAAVVALLMRRAALGVDMAAGPGLVTCVYLIGTAAILYHCRAPGARWRRVLRDGIEYCSLFGAICLLGALATYPVAADSSGFVDASLHRADGLLRFDWVAWYEFVAAHPALQAAERTAYESIFVTPAILLIHFAMAGRKAEARLFIASFWLAAVITLTLFMVAPAQGPLAFLWHGRMPYLPESALDQARLIPELRAHRLHVVDLGALHGLVSAPSFHAASALLFVAAAWPTRWLRWPVGLTNLAMLLATPIEGTHYLIDLIAGLMVALLSLLAMRLAASRLATDPDVPAFGLLFSVRPSTIAT